MATVVVDTVYIKNDNDVWLKGFRDSRAAEGVYLNAATVSFVVKKKDGTEVVSPVIMTYVGGSNGNYVGALESTQTENFIHQGTYYIEVTAVEGDVDGFWREQVTAMNRET